MLGCEVVALKGIFADEAADAVTGLTPKRQEFLAAMVKDPSLYVWGADPETGEAIVKTLDKATPQDPIKPFPTWDYLPFCLAEFHQGLLDARPQLPGMRAVDKPRQLMLSWLALVFIDWVGLSLPYSRNLLNKATQEESAFMIEDRLEKIVHRHWPQWFKDWAGCRWSANDETMYYGNGASFAATGANVADRAARGEQATVFFVDEAARHPVLKEVVAAIYPMSQLILMVSTPEAGSPGSAYYAEVLGRNEREE
jgi:hypothetical protein